MLNGLSLFSGGGALDLALNEWVRTVAYCENDRYAQAILLSRMRDRQLHIAPIWNDVRTLRGDTLGNWIDIICGGFPCQDISVAGNGKGLAGDRSGLVFDLLRLVGETGPQFVFLENVPAIINRGHGDILGALADMGYDARWTRVSAGETGAVHIRERWYLLAHSNRMRLRQERGQKIGQPDAQRSGPLVPYSQSSARRTYWTPERRAQPRVDRTGDGLSHRVDRHRVLGNSIHTKAAKEAFMRLMGIST